MMQTQNRIYLAYADFEEERRLVRSLYQRLKNHGFDPWLDLEDLDAGLNRRTEVNKVIRSASVVIVCLTIQSVRQPGNFHEEYRQALVELGTQPPGTIYLIPLRLEKCNVPKLQIPELQLSFEELYPVDLWKRGGFDQLVRALNKSLGYLERGATSDHENPGSVHSSSVETGAIAQALTTDKPRGPILRCPADVRPELLDRLDILHERKVFQTALGNPKAGDIDVEILRESRRAGDIVKVSVVNPAGEIAYMKLGVSAAAELAARLTIRENIRRLPGLIPETFDHSSGDIGACKYIIDNNGIAHVLSFWEPLGGTVKNIENLRSVIKTILAALRQLEPSIEPGTINYKDTYDHRLLDMESATDREEILVHAFREPISAANTSVDSYNVLWRHFGYDERHDMPIGLRLGNLSVDGMFIAKHSEKPIVLDCHIPRAWDPLLKDHTSLEASIWLNLLLPKFHTPQAAAASFLYHLASSQLFLYNNDSTDIESIIPDIRLDAWRLYENKSWQPQFLRHYVELLYHELILQHVSSLNDLGNRLNNLTVILHLLSSIIAAWRKQRRLNVDQQVELVPWQMVSESCEKDAELGDIFPGIYKPLVEGLVQQDQNTDGEALNRDLLVFRSTQLATCLHCLEAQATAQPEVAAIVGQARRMILYQIVKAYRLNQFQGEDQPPSGDSSASHSMTMAVQKKALQIHGSQNSKNKRKLRELLVEIRDLALVGEPGAGKSWSLRKFYLEQWEITSDRVSAPEGQGDAWLAVWAPVNRIPKMIYELPSFSNDQEAAKAMFHLLSCDERFIDADIDMQLWKALLDLGGFLFLFDSVNEVNPEERQAFARLLREWRQYFPKNRFIVVARKYHWSTDVAYFTQKSGGLDFPDVVEVLPLEEREVIDFINRYFDQNSDHGISDQLNQVLFENNPQGSILQLRKNPFFLDKIIFLYSKLGVLPRNRGTLFREYIREFSQAHEWKDLQDWMLQMLGMYMTYKSQRPLPKNDAHRILLFAFCTAPVELFYDGSISLLTPKTDTRPPYLGPDEIEQAVVALSEEDWSAEHERLLARFPEDMTRILATFESMLEYIDQNKNLQRREGDVEFSHQSFEEYFAAERFLLLREHDEDATKKYLRHKNFDEMLHIVVGCVFDNKEETIGEILIVLLKEEAQLAVVRDCLRKAEHVDEAAQRSIRSIANQFRCDPSAPDRIRANAVECLTEVDDRIEWIAVLQSDNGLEEGPLMWRAMLGAARSSAISAGEDEAPFTRLAYAVEQGLAARKSPPDLVNKTAEWIAADGNQLGYFQGVILVQFDVQLGEANPDERALQALWTAWKKMPQRLTEKQWISLIGNAVNTQYFNDLLTFQSNEVESFRRRLFVDHKKIVMHAIRHFADVVDRWEVPLEKLFSYCLDYEAMDYDLLNEFHLAFTKRGRFPYAVVVRAWDIDLSLLMQVGWDKSYLDYVSSKWPPAHDTTTEKKALLKALENVHPDDMIEFSKNLPSLMAYTWSDSQGDVAFVLKIVAKVAERIPPDHRFFDWRDILIDLVAEFQFDAVAKQLDSWWRLDNWEKRAIIALIRYNLSTVKAACDSTFLDLFERDCSGSTMFDLIMMANKTDYFILERPDLIQRSMEASFDTRVPLAIEKCSYSTRIAVHQVCVNRGFGNLEKTHPGHKSPLNDMSSFNRLLRCGMALEAAYMLFGNQSSWERIEEKLEDRLKSQFEAAKTHVDGFGNVKTSTSGGSRDDSDHRLDISSPTDLRKMVLRPSRLSSSEVCRIVAVMCANKDHLLKERLDALSASTSWKSEQFHGTDPRLVLLDDLRNPQEWMKNDALDWFEALYSKVNMRFQSDLCQKLIEILQTRDPHSSLAWRDVLSIRLLRTYCLSKQVEPPDFRTLIGLVLPLGSQNLEQSSRDVIADLIAVTMVAEGESKRRQNIAILQKEIAKALTRSPESSDCLVVEKDLLALRETSVAVREAVERRTGGSRITIPADLLSSL